MGRALLEGWLAQGIPAKSIAAVDPEDSARAACELKAVTLGASLEALALTGAPREVVLAVKPQVLSNVLGDYLGYSGQSLFISIAAGARIAALEQQLGSNTAVIRAMPNTPCAIRQGISVLCANPQVDGTQRQTAAELFSAVGDVAWIEDEGLMDAVTAVSGSGPAYVFLLMEALANAGVAMGLPEELALQLARTTVAGAGQLAMASPESPSTLRERVTSPGGTTAAALDVLMNDADGLQQLMAAAVQAARDRGRQLG